MKIPILRLPEVLLICIQCTNDVSNYPCAVSVDRQNISYSLDVFPVVSKSCAIPGCHIAAFPKGDFTKYNDLKERAGNGKLYFRLSSGQMPPADSKSPGLTICEVNIITRWINQGAKNN